MVLTDEQVSDTLAQPSALLAALAPSSTTVSFVHLSKHPIDA